MTKKFPAKQIIFEQLSAVMTVTFCISDTINRICFQISNVLTVNGSQISWSHPHEILLFQVLDGGTVHARQPFVIFVTFYWCASIQYPLWPDGSVYFAAALSSSRSLVVLWLVCWSTFTKRWHLQEFNSTNCNHTFDTLLEHLL